MAHLHYQDTGLSLENGGCVGDPHIVVGRCLVFLCILYYCCAAILAACGLEPHISLSLCNIRSCWDAAGSAWQQGIRVDFTVQWTAVLAGPRPVYDPSVQHQYEGTGAGTRPVYDPAVQHQYNGTGATIRATPPPSQVGPCLLPPPPPCPGRRHGSPRYSG